MQLSGYAPAFGCFFPQGGRIGAARKPWKSWPGFLPGPLNLVNPWLVDIHADQVDAFCPEDFSDRDLFLFLVS